MEARLGELVVQRLSPVNVDEVSGDFLYDGAMDRFAEFDVSLFFCTTACSAEFIRLPR